MEHIPPPRRINDPGPNLENLKPLPTTDFLQLDPSIRYLWFIGRLILWSILAVIGFMVLLFSSLSRTSFVAERPWFLPAVLLFFGALALLHMIWPFLSYTHYGYAVRRTDVLIRFGVLWKRVIAVPFARIQHVDSDAGPIERGFGVANLAIHTAGSQLGSVTIPGLPSERAEALRDYLSEVGHAHANL